MEGAGSSGGSECQGGREGLWGTVIWRGRGGQGHVGDFRVQALVPAWEIREDRGWDVAQSGEAGRGDSPPFFSPRGGMAEGELACGFRVPVRGTAGVWGWKEEKQEGQDGPSVVHRGEGLLEEKGSEPFSHLRILLLLSLRSQIKDVYFLCCAFSTYKVGVVLRLLNSGSKALESPARGHLSHAVNACRRMQEGATCMLAGLSVTLN